MTTGKTRDGVAPCVHRTAARGLRVSSGIRCTLDRPELPGVRNYYVVALPNDTVSGRDVEDLYRLAHRVGRLLGRQHFGDAECYTLMYSATRTRRCPWPHVHVIIACSVADKRRNMILLQLKHVLRWRKWPLIRWLFYAGNGIPPSKSERSERAITEAH